MYVYIYIYMYKPYERVEEGTALVNHPRLQSGCTVLVAKVAREGSETLFKAEEDTSGVI